MSKEERMYREIGALMGRFRKACEKQGRKAVGIWWSNKIPQLELVSGASDVSYQVIVGNQPVITAYTTGNFSTSLDFEKVREIKNAAEAVA